MHKSLYCSYSLEIQNKLGKDKSCIVFIGNVPFGASEHELYELFRKVGPVVAVKIMQDKETNRPRGYAFCEYRDTATAESAIRNLNNYIFRERPLRVFRADRQTDRPREKSSIASAIPDPRDLASPEKVTEAVKAMSPEQMIAVLSEFKELQATRPEAATRLLEESPQLAIAILEIQFMFSLLKPDDLRSLLPTVTAQAQHANQPPPQPPVHEGQHRFPPNQPQPSHQPPFHQPPTHHMGGHAEHSAPMHNYPPLSHPSMHMQHPHAPPHHGYAPGPGSRAPPALAPDEMKFLDMIGKLPEKERKLLAAALNAPPERLEQVRQTNPKIMGILEKIKSLKANGIHVPL